MSRPAVPALEKFVRSTTGDVVARSAILHGYYVNTAVATGAIVLSETVAGSVTTVMTIPLCAAGTNVWGLWVPFVGKITATFGGTGNVTFTFV